MVAMSLTVGVMAQSAEDTTTTTKTTTTHPPRTPRPVDPKVAEQKAKMEEARKAQQAKIAEQKQKMQEERDKQKQKLADEKAKQQAKIAEQKEKQQQKLADQKEKQQSKSPSGTKEKVTTSERPTAKTPTTRVPHVTTKPDSHGKKKEDPDAPEPDPEVTTLYYQLPLEDLPQVSEYITVMRPINNNDDLKDGKDLRKGFISHTDGTRQYLTLQRPGETKYTRIQEYKTKDFKRILAVETTECTGTCTNDLKFYRLEGNEWKDATNDYLYKVDQKTAIKKIKDKYKEEYMDTELFDSKGYDDPSSFAQAINYNISPDENKIIIKDQYLPLNLYEMTWNQDKGKFDVKKL
jgi:hypothetical protein